MTDSKLNQAALIERGREIREDCQTLVDRVKAEGRDLTDAETEYLERESRVLFGIAATVETKAKPSAAELRWMGPGSFEPEETEELTDEQTALQAERSAELNAAFAEVQRRQSGESFGGGRPPTLLVSTDNLRSHADALAEGHSFGAVEHRAAITVASDMGSEGNWATSGPQDPRHLIAYSGIPVTPLTGGRPAQVPQYTLPSGAAGVAETVAHPEFDAVAPIDLTVVRHGRWSQVTAATDAFDALVGINGAHGVGIARDLDLAAVSDIETAAGSPLAFNADIAGNVRLALNTVAATVYSQVEMQVIFGTPGDIALLQDVDPTSGGDNGSVSARFSGARLYPSLAATAGQVTVFAPAAFMTFMTAVRSASQIDPTDGSNSFGSWLHATGVAMQFVGGAVAVDVVTP